MDAEPTAPLGTGLSGEPLHPVRCGGIWAVAGEMTTPPAVDAASLQGHDAVVRRLADNVAALLPARFGTRVADEPALVETLTSRAAALGEALATVRGCVQMTLRVFGTGEAPSPTLPRSEGEGATGPGTRYLEARRRERERLAALPEIEPLRPALGPHLRAERVERRGASLTGLLVGTAYHLVPRPSLAQYRAALEATGGELPGGFRLAWSGPWPAYAFAGEVAP